MHVQHNYVQRVSSVNRGAGSIQSTPGCVVQILLRFRPLAGAPQCRRFYVFESIPSELIVIRLHHGTV